MLLINRIPQIEFKDIVFYCYKQSYECSKTLVKKKNEDIAALRKQLKFPSSEHPQAKEIIQGQNEKADMIDLSVDSTYQRNGDSNG